MSQEKSPAVPAPQRQRLPRNLSLLRLRSSLAQVQYVRTHSVQPSVKAVSRASLQRRLWNPVPLRYPRRMRVHRDEMVFVSGGVVKVAEKEIPGRTFVICDKKAIPLKKMLTNRHWHGLHYDEPSRQIFAFGGTVGTQNVTNKCEQYDLASGDWTALHNMPCRMTCVSTCSYQGKVFLIGNEGECDIFTIASKKFAYSSLANHYGSRFPIIVAWKEEIIVFQELNVSRWNANSLELIAETNLTEKRYSKFALVVNDELFFMTYDGCDSLNLQTMTEGMRFPH